MAARLEARVRKHTEDISRSLEKICDIIDEHQEDDWDQTPNLLSLIPMRYRAGGYVLELTAMDSRNHDGLHRVELPEVCRALSKAFVQAREVPSALSDAIYEMEPNERLSELNFDGDTLRSVMDKIAYSIKIPHLDKTASNYISIFLRKELQDVADNKISNANKSIGGWHLPEDRQVTRSWSRLSNITRSDSPHTITPTSSRDERGKAQTNYVLDEGWATHFNGCVDRCDLCLQEGNQYADNRVFLCHGWGCNDLNCDCTEPKKSQQSKQSKKASSCSRAFTRRHDDAKTSSPVTRKHARHSPDWSATSSESGSHILRGVQTISLDGGSDLHNTSRESKPRIHQATTASSAPAHIHKPSVHIVSLRVEEIESPAGVLRRQGRVGWSNGSWQTMWMDELSREYPQQLIEYYEKALPSKPQQQVPRSPSRPQGAPNYESALPNTKRYGSSVSPLHTQWRSQYYSNGAPNPVTHPSMTGHSLFFNNTETSSEPYSGAFGMNGNTMGNADSAGYGHKAPFTMPISSPMSAQYGSTHAPNQYNFAPGGPRHTSFGNSLSCRYDDEETFEMVESSSRPESREFCHHPQPDINA